MTPYPFTNEIIEANNQWLFQPQGKVFNIQYLTILKKDTWGF